MAVTFRVPSAAAAARALAAGKGAPLPAPMRASSPAKVVSALAAGKAKPFSARQSLGARGGASKLPELASLVQQTNTSPSAASGQVASIIDYAPAAGGAPATGSPSGFFGIPEATGSPSAFFGTSPDPALAAKPAGAGRAPGTFPSATPPAAAKPPDPYGALAGLQAQAQSMVKAEVDPVLAEIASSINAQSTAGQNAVKSLAQYFAPQLEKLAGINTAGLQTGVAGQAAIDDAVYQALSGAGGSAADELAGKLAQINAPDQAGDVATTRALGTGAANAALASGSASLSALNARLAAANDVAQKIPGLAALYGEQGAKQIAAAADANLATEQGKVTAQVPGMVQQLLGTLASNEQKAETSWRSYLAGLQKQKEASTGAQYQIVDNGPGSGGIRPVLDKNGQPVPTASALTAEAKAAATAAQTQTAADKRLSDETGYVYLNGKPVTVKGQPVPTVAEQGLQAKQQTAAQQQKAAQVRAIISEGYDPVTGKLTPSARARLASVLGYDPITGQPTAATAQKNASLKVQQQNANTAAARANEQIAHDKAIEKIDQQRVNLTAGSQRIAYQKMIDSENRAIANAKTAQSKTAWQQAKDDAAQRSKSGDLWIVKMVNGQPKAVQWMQNGKPVQARSFAKSAFSAGQLARYNGQAETLAATAYQGGTDSKGNKLAPISYQQALEEARQSGIPDNITIKHLNRFYSPGERGRPETPADVKARRTAIRNSLYPPFVNG